MHLHECAAAIHILTYLPSQKKESNFMPGLDPLRNMYVLHTGITHQIPQRSNCWSMSSRSFPTCSTPTIILSCRQVAISDMCTYLPLIFLPSGCFRSILFCSNFWSHKAPPLRPAVTGPKFMSWHSICWRFWINSIPALREIEARSSKISSSLTWSWHSTSWPRAPSTRLFFRRERSSLNS